MEITLKVGGMSCKHCVAHVNTALVGLDGVSNVGKSLWKMKMSRFHMTPKKWRKRISRRLSPPDMKP